MEKKIEDHRQGTHVFVMRDLTQTRSSFPNFLIHNLSFNVPAVLLFPLTVPFKDSLACGITRNDASGWFMGKKY